MSRRYRLSLRYLLFLGLPGWLGAQSAPVSTSQKGLDQDARVSAMVDSLVRAHMVQHRIVGASVVVMRGDRVLKSAAYGMANEATGEVVTPATTFFVASITKAFTAAAVTALVEDGKFKLDDPIGTLTDDLPVGWRPVTVRQLLTFSSGLPEVKMAPGVSMATYDALLDSLRAKPFEFEPGAQRGSAGINYYLLGRLIEKYAGRSYDAFVQSRLLGPLGISTAAFGDYALVRPGRAEWYTVINVDSSGKVSEAPERTLLRTVYPRYHWPGAGMYISADDLARWVAAFAHGRVVSPASVETLWTPTTLKDGSRAEAGWATGEGLRGRYTFAEGGARASVMYWRDTDVTVAVLTNTQGADEVTLALAVTRAYVPPR